MNCSLVVRAYNEGGHIGRLLEGLRRQTVQDVELILVDSGSTDRTVEIARSYGAVIVHISASEFSFGRSLNRGLEVAGRERVVIASAHVYPVYPDWLECLLRPLDDLRVAVVYGKQRGTADSRFSEVQVLRQWFPERDIARQESPFCNNANAAIRRSLWQRHAYDESLTGLEDVAWAKWAQGEGYSVAYSAHAEVIHVHIETPRAVFERYRREAMAFKRIFAEAHFNVYDFVRLTATNIVNDIRLAARERQLLRQAASIVWFRTMQFWGTYQGYRHSGPVTQALRRTFYYPHQDLPSSAGRDVEPLKYDD